MSQLTQEQIARIVAETVKTLEDIPHYLYATPGHSIAKTELNHRFRLDPEVSARMFAYLEVTGEIVVTKHRVRLTKTAIRRLAAEYVSV